MGISRKAGGVVRVACAVALASMLAACDKCGDWVSPIRFQADLTLVCKDEAPKKF